MAIEFRSRVAHYSDKKGTSTTKKGRKGPGSARKKRTKRPPAKRNSFRTCVSSLFFHYWADWERPPAAPNIIRRDTRLYWQPQRQGNFGRCVGAFVGENPGSAESIFGLGFGATGPGRTGQSSTLPETKRTFPLPSAIITGRKRPTIGCSLEQSRN
jgi:hypothetical protein